MVKYKIGKGNLLPENRFSMNKMWCGADNQNYVCHACAKECLDANVN